MESQSLHRCCICIPLRVGAFILGYILTIVKIILFFATLMHATLQRMVIQQNQTHDSKLYLLTFVFYLSAFICAMEMTISAFLLVGLHKRKLEYVEKFYKVYSILFVINMIAFLIALVFNMQQYTYVHWLLHLVDLALWLLEIYTVYIAYRCAIEMKTQLVPRQGIVYDDAPTTQPNNSYIVLPTYNNV